MVETPRSSAEDLSTSREAIIWTETSSNSKLKEIKGLVDKSDNPNIKNLMNFIVNQDYVGLQRAIGYKGKLDGKLGKNSLEATEKFIVKEDTNLSVKELAENISTLYSPKKETTDTGIKNIRTNRGERWNASLNKYEKYEEEEGFIVEGNKIIIKNLSPLIYDNAFSNKKINETINDIHIKFNGNNIILNNKYVINPIGIIGFYEDINQIDEWANNLRQKSQCGVIKPLYDYLNKNRDKFEEKRPNTNTNNTAEDTRGSSTRQPEVPESVPSNLEWKNCKNEKFDDVEVPVFVPEPEPGMWVGGGKLDLRVSNIAKTGNTLILNKGKFEITYVGNSTRLDEENMSLKMRIYDSSINRYRSVTWKYDSSELGTQGTAPHRRRSIYNQLNREYFS